MGRNPHQYLVTKDNWKQLPSNLKDKLPIGTGIFVLTDGEKQAMHLDPIELDEIVKPFYTAQELGKYSPISQNRFSALIHKIGYQPAN